MSEGSVGAPRRCRIRVGWVVDEHGGPTSRMFVQHTTVCVPAHPLHADFAGFAKDNGAFCTSIPLAPEVTRVLEQETLRAGDTIYARSMLQFAKPLAAVASSLTYLSIGVFLASINLQAGYPLHHTMQTPTRWRS